MKYFTVAFFAVWSLSAFAEKPQSVEIRFCPASAVRTYPLESRRDLQSLLLQNVAVINHGSAPFKIENIEIELLRSNRVIESRNVDREAVQRIADRGAKLQAAGILQQVGFQFCGTDLIAPSITLAGGHPGSRQSTAHRIAGHGIQRPARHAPSSRARQLRRPCFGIHWFNPDQI